MQFKLITAILASAAVSGVAAGPIEARQDDKASQLAESAAAVAKPGDSSAAENSFDFSNLVQGATSAAAAGGVPQAVDPNAAAFAIPFGGGNLKFGDITINQPAPKPDDCSTNYYKYGCPGNPYPYPGYYPPPGPVYPATYPTYQYCVTYGFPPGCEAYKPAPAPTQCPPAWQLKCLNPNQCYQPQPFPSSYGPAYFGKYYCTAISIWGTPACECSYP